MERKESNWTLLPFCAVAAAAAAVLSWGCGFRGAALIGMFAVFCIAGFFASLLLYVLILGAVALFVDKSKPQEGYAPFYNAMVTFVMGLVPALMRVRIHIAGAEKIPAEGRFLLVGNHRSAFDPLVTGWALRRTRLAFVSKPENLAIPVVGEFVHKANFLAIDRENDRAALKTILEAARRIREGLISYGIYPEGTRNTGERLLPFRNGAFKIAQRAKAPIVVAVTRGTDLVRKNFPWKPTDVYLNFCAVLDTEAVAGKKTGEIGEEVRKCMNFANC